MLEDKNILITGGCGFIGHAMVEHFVRKTKANVKIIDKLSYSSNGLERLRDIDLLENKRVQIFTFDLINEISEGLKQELGEIHYIIHLAAESHVDNSIKEPVKFILNNVKSTLSILEFSRQCKKLEKIFYFSTDEVYGSAENGIFYKETDRHKPTNPYSASKSCGEQIAVSYENTYNIPLIIVNSMNCMGQRQCVEKFIPKCIKYILEDKTIEIHADKECKVSGSRYYIHIRNIADAILFLIFNGKIGELYNITGEKEISNLEMAQFISKTLEKPLKYKLVNFHEERPGHDLRYALDGTKLFNLGFKLPVNFEESLKHTVLWTEQNRKWLE